MVGLALMESARNHVHYFIPSMLKDNVLNATLCAVNAVVVEKNAPNARKTFISYLSLTQRRMYAQTNVLMEQ